MIKDIAFTAYPAADVAKLVEFYSNSLGLNLSDKYEEDGKLQYAEFEVGNSWFSVMTHEWMDVPPGSAAGVALEVDNIEQTLKELGSKGITTERIHDTPVCRLASFKDPEGNKVTLHQSTRQH
ncbi:MAG: VOC family protein [Candidatus Eremiobacteraeota bacterium]|nr:VOC family protein [Candidatus Eremiobacteraeota bacterium]